jgi:outer membrane autotransporter protein
LQGTYYNSDSAANAVTNTPNGGIHDLKTGGTGFAASLEGGKPFSLGKGYFVEPQAQVAYQTISLNEASDNAALVEFSDVNSLTARIGARLGRAWSLDKDTPNGREMRMWVRPDIWHEFLGDPLTRFSAEDSVNPFHADLGGTWGGITAGMNGQITGNISLFMNASYNTRLDGNGHSYDGKAGIRFNW